MIVVENERIRHLSYHDHGVALPRRAPLGLGIVPGPQEVAAPTSLDLWEAKV